jgi:heme exporter protein D
MIAGLGPHAAFIVAAYAAAALIVTTLVSWVALDYGEQQRALNEFEKRGVKRRSAAKPSPRRRR